MNNFPAEVLGRIFSLITSREDQSAVSIVCKTWYKIDMETRRRVIIGNCYAVTPEKVVARFPRVRALTLKGKPKSPEFGLVLPSWGGFVDPWIQVLAKSCPDIEELRLKRMVVSDESLLLLANSFPNLRSLVLASCEGLRTDGLAAVVSKCRHLRELDLSDSLGEDGCGNWLCCFPKGITSLELLNFSQLECEVHPAGLECLVARSPNLRALRVNMLVPFATLLWILQKAPQLVDLGTGRLVRNPYSPSASEFRKAVSTCHSIRSLSGFWNVNADCLVAMSDMHPLCFKLTSLDLSCALYLDGDRAIKMISLCRKLQHLWILDSIEDTGLKVVADTCKDLEELQIFPANQDAEVTGEGLVTISNGCPKLNFIHYHCHQLTNASLVAMAKNCQNLIRFSFNNLSRGGQPDPVTSEPLDEGIGAIVQFCKKLRRLSVSGLWLTDECFLNIGKYGEQLKTLSVAYTGESDKAMRYVLNGCKNLRKLEFRYCPFGDAALLGEVQKHEKIRSLCMTFCELTFKGCKALAKENPGLNVEIIDLAGEFKEGDEVGLGTSSCQDDMRKVEKMCLYRTLVGPRNDAPEFVRTL